MFDSVRAHRRQPTGLPRPWDSPGKNTGVGCHCLLQCMKVRSESEAAQSCPTVSDPMDCSLPGPSVHGIFQTRVLEWGAIAFSLVSSTNLKNWSREKAVMNELNKTMHHSLSHSFLKSLKAECSQWIKVKNLLDLSFSYGAVRMYQISNQMKIWRQNLRKASLSIQQTSRIRYS